jgi:hypothetical protein
MAVKQRSTSQERMIDSRVRGNAKQSDVALARTTLIPISSDTKRRKACRTFLDILEGHIENPNTRNDYKNSWRAFFSFCSEYELELRRVKPYHDGMWLKRRPDGVSTQRQEGASGRLM